MNFARKKKNLYKIMRKKSEFKKWNGKRG